MWDRCNQGQRGHLGSSLLAAQPNSLVQQLGHLLVVGMVLSSRSRLDEAVVLQLLHCLLREALHLQCLVVDTAMHKVE